MTTYTCRRCGYSQESLWEGACPGCRGFYRATKSSDGAAPGKQKATFASAPESSIEYVPTGLAGLDITLGGGVVAGSAYLFGGFRGAGKSSLLVAAADAMSRRRKVVFASSEQSEQGVLSIAHRVGAASDKVTVLGGQRVVERTIQQVKHERAFLTFYDSLQKYVSETSGGAPGSTAQGTAVAHAIMDDCRARNSCAVIVNQMARSGELKGGTDVEHDVDMVMVLGFPKLDDEEAPGSQEDGIRMLVVEKSRQASENLKTYWKMHDHNSERPGTIEYVPARSKLLEFPRRSGKYGGRL